MKINWKVGGQTNSLSVSLVCSRRCNFILRQNFVASPPAPPQVQTWACCSNSMTQVSYTRDFWHFWPFALSWLLAVWCPSSATVSLGISSLTCLFCSDGVIGKNTLFISSRRYDSRFLSLRLCWNRRLLNNLPPLLTYSVLDYLVSKNYKANLSYNGNFYLCKYYRLKDRSFLIQLNS